MVGSGSMTPRIRYWLLWAALLNGNVAHAQSPMSATIGGRILDEQGQGLPGVEVTVTQPAAGVAVRAISRADGRYLIGGLEVGGPYTVTARRVGTPSSAKTGLFLSL